LAGVHAQGAEVGLLHADNNTAGAAGLPSLAAGLPEIPVPVWRCTQDGQHYTSQDPVCSIDVQLDHLDILDPGPKHAHLEPWLCVVSALGLLRHVEYGEWSALKTTTCTDVEGDLLVGRLFCPFSLYS
jgi:hypothetical protein